MSYVSPSCFTTKTAWPMSGPSSVACDTPGSLVRGASIPNDTLEFSGNGNGQQQATVEVTLKVADEHEPGDYLCVSIQVYDVHGNVVIIKTPSPSRLFRIVDEGKRDDKKTEFLGWGD